MVNNIWNILDEGQNKYLDIYKMKDPVYFTEFKDKLKVLKELKRSIEHEEWCLRKGYQGKDIYEKERIQNELILRLKMEFNELNDPFLEGYLELDCRQWFKMKPSPRIAEFMGAMPFYPSVMINISPNWKGMEWNKLTIKQFRKVIESYLNEQIGPNKRYTKWKYCIECGANGDFLHAHIVAEINNKILESMKTHINKGNHKQQLMKYWDKVFPKGKQGLLKGKFSVQRILINTEEILNDKLDYLLERNKMEGHQNAKDLNLVFGDF